MSLCSVLGRNQPFDNCDNFKTTLLRKNCKRTEDDTNQYMEEWLANILQREFKRKKLQQLQRKNQAQAYDLRPVTICLERIDVDKAIQKLKKGVPSEAEAEDECSVDQNKQVQLPEPIADGETTTQTRSGRQIRLPLKLRDESLINVEAPTIHLS